MRSPDPPSTWVSLVLAAGQGRRMGFPKALLAWPSVAPDDARETSRSLPLSLVHAAMHHRAGAAHAVVVVRREVADTLIQLADAVDPCVHVAVSDEADSLGPAGSLRRALQMLSGMALPPDARVLCTPVDAAPPSPSTVKALLSAVSREGAVAARPVHEGRRGHPVVLGLGALAAYDGDEPPPLRNVLRSLGDRCRDVAVSDPAVTTNLDRPEDVRAWLGEDARPWRGGSM